MAENRDNIPQSPAGALRILAQIAPIETLLVAVLELVVG